MIADRNPLVVRATTDCPAASFGRPQWRDKSRCRNPCSRRFAPATNIRHRAAPPSSVAAADCRCEPSSRASNNARRTAPTPAGPSCISELSEDWAPRECPETRIGVEHADPVKGSQIDDLIADRHTAAKLLRGVAPAEYREGQVLEGKIAAEPIGRLQPAACPRIVRLVECVGIGHGRAGSKRLFRPDQQDM